MDLEIMKNQNLLTLINSFVNILNASQWLYNSTSIVSLLSLSTLIFFYYREKI